MANREQAAPAREHPAARAYVSRDPNAARIRRVLAAVDLERDCTTVLRYGAWLAAQLGSELDLLFVVASPLSEAPVAGVWAAGDLERDVEVAFRREAHADLKRLVARFEPTLAVRPRIVVTSGDPAREIVRATETLGCDRVLLGAQRGCALLRWLFGSVAASVAQGCACPVLTIAR